MQLVVALLLTLFVLNVANGQTTNSEAASEDEQVTSTEPREFLTIKDRCRCEEKLEEAPGLWRIIRRSATAPDTLAIGLTANLSLSLGLSIALFRIRRRNSQAEEKRERKSLG